MKITIMGTGGVGGYFGARLATAGEDVTFIARGSHLKAIKTKGLHVISDLGNVSISNAKAEEKPDNFGIADIVLFCVKAYDAATAAEVIRPIIGPETGVIPILNGIEHIEILKRILGTNSVLGGVANISALIEKPGVIRHYGSIQTLRVGELDNRQSNRITAFRAACERANIDVPVPENIETELWQKMTMICTLAGANCLTRLPLGQCRRDPATRQFMRTLALETIAVARSKDVTLPQNQIDLTMELLDNLPENMKASILSALERGDKLEASALNGAIDRLGREAGIDTPGHRAVYAALAPHEKGI
tara:strand:+ start:756 stop:1673 length:918 start_codon:yes stop_codon:yes gene_type:complete